MKRLMPLALGLLLHACSASPVLAGSASGVDGTVDVTIVGSGGGMAQESGGNLDQIQANTAAINSNTTNTSGYLSQLVAATAPLSLNPLASAAACKVLKNSAGTWYSASGSVGAAGEYILVFDSATQPSNGTVAPIAIDGPISVAGPWSMIAGPPISFANGLTICASTGANPYTLTAVASGAALTANFITGQVN